MDKASLTIDRHTPSIPESLWCGLTPEREAAYTLLKNTVILPMKGLSNSNKPGRVSKDQTPRVITDAILNAAQTAVASVAGQLEPPLLDYLAGRGINAAEIASYQMCSTQALVAGLDYNIITNLTLRLPDKLLKFVSSTEIVGISIPCYYQKLFCGFATRVLNHSAVKYAFSIPNRLCFGVDLDRDDVYVVEGVFDAIALRRFGYNVLGMGDSQPNFFKMMVAAKFKQINLLFDDDYAGWLGLQKAYAVLTEMCAVTPDRIIIREVGGGHDPEMALRFRKSNFNVITLDEAVARTIRWRKWLIEQRELCDT